MISTEDWSDRFIGWYAELLEKLEVQESNPSIPFRAEDLKKLQDTFAYIQAHLQQKCMGAGSSMPEKLKVCGYIQPEQPIK